MENTALSSRFIEVDKVNFPSHTGKLQAAHCMIYAKLPGVKVIHEYDALAAVFMQTRFDGNLGFPGGLIEPGEEVVPGLIRELIEEMNFDSDKHIITEDHHVVTHWSKTDDMLLHFYAFEVSSKEDFEEVERRALQSHDYGDEVMGFFRVPLYTMSDGFRGFPSFLKNSFAGNACQQLKLGLKHAGVMSKEEITSAEQVKIPLN